MVPVWLVTYGDGTIETHYTRPHWLDNDREGKAHRDAHGGIVSVVEDQAPDPLADYQPTKETRNAA
jgi:hypothetical protein